MKSSGLQDENFPKSEVSTRFLKFISLEGTVCAHDTNSMLDSLGLKPAQARLYFSRIAQFVDNKLIQYFTLEV